MNSQIELLAEEAHLERQKLLRIVKRYGGPEEYAALERLVVLCVAITDIQQRQNHTVTAEMLSCRNGVCMSNEEKKKDDLCEGICQGPCEGCDELRDGCVYHLSAPEMKINEIVARNLARHKRKEAK